MNHRTGLGVAAAFLLLAGSGARANEPLVFCPIHFDPIEFVQTDPATGSALLRNQRDGRDYTCELNNQGNAGFDCVTDPRVGDVGSVIGISYSGFACSPAANPPFGIALDIVGGPHWECNYYCRITARRVAIDIMPNNPQNPLAISSGGVTPVAILSDPSFDARLIKQATISLAGAGVRSGGQSGRPSCQQRDVGGPSGSADGLIDLVCHVETDQIVPHRRNGKTSLVAETYTEEVVVGADFVQQVPDDGIEYYCPMRYDPVVYTDLDTATGAASLENLEDGRSYECTLSDRFGEQPECLSGPMIGDVVDLTSYGTADPLCSPDNGIGFTAYLSNRCIYHCDAVPATD